MRAWRFGSPSGATYPAGWRFQIPAEGLDLTITPLLADQELRLSTTYWEGAVEAHGTVGEAPVSARGFVELTGYADPPDPVRSSKMSW